MSLVVVDVESSLVSLFWSSLESFARGKVGGDVISLISASISSVLISAGESFPFWDISARVFVRSTRVSRPSAAERRRTDIVAGLVFLWWGSVTGGEYNPW